MVAGKLAVMKVYNKATDNIPDGSIYIGRPSKWGNPFVIGADGNRKDVLDKYENYLRANVELMACIHELEGKNLVCWCRPVPCHGDVIIKILEELNREQYIER